MAKRPFGRFNRVHVAGTPAPVARNYYVICSGGGISSGAATYQRQGSGAQTRTWLGTGGAIASGTATRTRTRARVGSGGAVALGSATTTFQHVGGAVFAYVGSGGAVAAGAATATAQTSATYAVITWAALEIPAGPEESWPTEYAYLATGGSASAGTAAWLRILARTGSGGASASGSAATVLEGSVVAGTIVGVCTQNVIPLGALDSMMTAGLDVSWVRLDVFRSHTENKTGGVYNGTYTWTEFDPFFAKCVALGLRHTLILFYGADPWDDDFTGFANWAAALLLYEQSTYGIVSAVEVWNEPDGSWPVSAADYCTLIAATTAAIRAHSELDDIPICGGVTWGAHDLTYWDALYAGGALDDMDVISVHSYIAPEAFLTTIPTLRSHLGDTTKPIYLSEWGATSDPVTVQKMLTIIKVLNIWAAAYFVLEDYYDFPTGGLLNSSGVIKPTGTAWVEWHSRIGTNAAFLQRDTLNSVSYSFKFSKGGNIVRIMWATAPTDIFIAGVKTTLTNVPVYVDGDVTVVLSSVEALRADLTGEFTTAGQGQPFYYLTRSLTDTGEAQMSVSGGEWVGTEQYTRIFAGGQCPGQTSKVVTRWVVPSDMRLRIQGEVLLPQLGGGDGTNVRIKHNASIKYFQLANAVGIAYPFYLIFDASAGDVIEFESDPVAIVWWGEVFWSNTLIYSTAHPLQFDFSNDWSLSQAQPWEFLYRNNDDTGEARMILVSNTWVAPSNYYCACQYGNDMRPSWNYKCVKRLHLPEPANIRVTGTWQRYEAGGDGSNVRILHNSIIMQEWTAIADTGVRQIDISFICAAGDYLDFEVGSGGVEDWWDPIYVAPVVTWSAATPVAAGAGMGLRGTQVPHDEGWDAGTEAALAQYGINPTFIRFGMSRYQTEVRDANGWTGTYQFAPTSILQGLDYLKNHGMKHLWVATYGGYNPWDDDFTGMANWIVAGITWHKANYPGVLHTIEIWNEPDGNWPVGVLSYVQMAQTIQTAVRAHPEFDDIKLAGPVLTYFNNYRYWDALVTNGLLDYIDQVSMHHYQTASHIAEVLPPFLATLQTNPKPIIVTEWGAWGSTQYEVAHILSLFKTMGVLTSSFFTSAQFGAGGWGGLIDWWATPPNLLTDNGKRFIEWHNTIGDDAVALGRDTLTGHAYCYGFNVGGTIKHFGWSDPPTRVIADGQVIYLTETGKYITANTVAVDPAWNRTYRAQTADLPTVQGTDGWYFLERNLDDSAEAQMTWNTEYKQWWGAEHETTQWWLAIHQMGILSPGPSKKAVRRWIATNTERLLIHGYIYKGGGGDGVTIRIKRNTTVKYQQFIQSGAPWVHVAFDVTAGDHIDFEADPGSGGDNTGDATYLSVSLWGVDSNYLVDLVEDKDAPWEYLTRANDDTGQVALSFVGNYDRHYYAPSDPTAQLAEDGYVIPSVNQKIIHRWTAPAGYTATISGAVERPQSGGDGTNIRILHNGSVIWSKLPLLYADGIVSFSINRTITQNDTIEFEVGSGGSDAANDGIYWQDVKIRGT